MEVILTEALRKRYGKTVALDGLDLSVAAGEVFGFIGPNGAGKSTTIRVLLGLLRPDGGRARLFGGDPWKQSAELHKRLAYVPSEVSLWESLTGGEVIDLLARMRGPVRAERRAELLERFDLDPSKKCGTYSKGNKQKVALIAAFVSDVELYILDEPTAGLDPLMELVFQKMIGELKREGKTVFLSSHILGEVEAICDNIGIIKRGKTVATDRVDRIKGMSLETFFERYYQGEVEP